MKRIHYFNYALALVFSLMAFTASAQITVGSGTDENQSIPMEPFYGYSYSQSIYLQSEISATGSITTLSWYFSGTSTMNNTQDLVIWMGHSSKTSYTSTTDWVDTTTLTRVYAGNLGTPTGPGWITITLDNSFAYNNTDNLIIAVDENTPSWNGSTDDFYCSAVALGRSIYYRNDATNPDPGLPPSASGTPSYIPNVQLGGLTAASPPTCDAALTSPANAATGVFELADLTWSGASGSPTGYKLQIGTTMGGSEFLAQTDVGNVTTYTPASAFALNTTYYVTITPYNGNGDAVGCTEESFTTRAVTANTVFPFIENFDAATSLPTGWTSQGVEQWSYTSGAMGHGAQSDHTSGSGNFAKIDDSSPNNANPATLITPPMDLTGLTTPRLVLWYQNRNISTNTGASPLHIDVYNGSIWTNNVLSVTANIHAWTEYTLDLTAYKSANTYIRIRTIEDPSGFNSDPSLDDVKIEETPTCPKPGTLTSANVTFNSADLGWTDNAGATSWQVEYGPDGFAPGMGVGTATAVVTGSNPYSASSLTENTTYDFYVRAICAPGDTSVWSAEGTFTTPLACPLPTALTASNLTATTADFGWTDNAGATAWDVEYGTVGFTQGAGTMVTGTATNPHNITGLSAGVGYSFYVRADCGGNGTSPWVGPFSFATPFQAATGVTCTTPGAISSVLFSEEFDNNTAGWTGDVGTSNGDWEIPNGSGSNPTGADNAHSGSSFMNYEASNSSVNQGSIVSPAINLTGGFDAAELSFWIHAFGANMGTLNVGVGTSASGPFTTVMTSIGQLQTAGSDPWQNVGVDLTAYIGQTIYLQFTQIDDQGSFYGDMSIDLVEVTTCEKCRAPSSLMASNVTTSGADLAWTENGTATTWDIEWGTAGFTATGTPTVTGTTTNPHALSSLTANTSYDFYVRADCGGNGTSPWAGPYTFTTACNVFSAFPFMETFESTSSSLSCWNTSRASGSRDWEFGTDGSQSINGNDMALFDDDAAGSGQVNNATLTSPVFDMTGITAARLNFDYNFLASGSLNVEVWDGAAWQNVLAVTSNACGSWGCAYPSANIDISAHLNAAMQVRYVYDDAGGWQWYAAVDNFNIEEILANDVGVTAINVVSSVCNAADSVKIDITNFGTATQTTFPVSYTVNGGTAVSATWTGSLAAGATMQYTFATTYDASMGGNYDVQAYTTLATDGNNANDSTTITRTTAPTYATAFGEDLEGASLPDWTSDGTWGTGHNSGSNVIYKNMWNAGSANFTTTLPKVGAIAAGDILKFDYRYADYAGGAGNLSFALGTGDTLKVQISTDCGATFTTIDTVHEGNHVTSVNFAAKKVDLSAYAGQNIVVRIAAVRATGDYFLDLDNFFIGAPLMISTSVAANITCNGAADGESDVDATGGLAPYTYMWDANAGSQANDTATALMAGKYLVTVTDAIGNMAVDSITITDPTILTSSVTQTNVLCTGATTGSGMVTGAGGTGMYSYAWDVAAGSQITATATGLAAGKYLVTLTDANGCMTKDSVTITEPAMALSSSITAQTNILCNGAATGSATAAGTGGTGTLTYGWNDAASQTTATATGLVAGTYNVTVTDANGCTSISSVTITEPAALTSSITAQTNVSCNGGNDGAATVTEAGGTTGYTYLWDDATAQTTATATGLTAGTYNVTVTDANSCTTISSVVLTSPSVLSASTSIFSNVSCNGGNDGAIDLMVSGGTAPYTYVWDNGATTEDIFNVAAGTYNVTITDANGCTPITATATVTESNVLTTSTSVTDVLCNGNTDGMVDLTVLDGTAPYSYNWDNGASGQDLTGVGVGIYNVTVTDANGCTTTNMATVGEPTALSITTESVADTNTLSIGEATATAAGGIAPYTYAWDNGMTGDMISGLGFGTYGVTATDANGCTITGSVLVDSIITTSTTPIDFVTNLSVFPNPTAGNITIDLELSDAKDVNVVIYNMTGQLVKDFGHETTVKTLINTDLSTFPSGVYFVRFIIDNQVVTKRLILAK